MPPLDELTERTVRQDSATARALMAILGQAIAARSLVWVALLAGIGLWCWAAVKPDWIRSATVAAYSLLIFLPLLWKGFR